MIVWLVLLAGVAVVLLALWRLAGLDRASLQMVAAALLVGLAGYAWQGRPDVPGKPLPPTPITQGSDSDFAKVRGDLLGRFDTAARWLTLAEMFQRRGDTYSAVGIIRSGIREHPRDADLWVGLGNALVLHADGMMNPAAELAFERAERLAPGHPAPKFFYGLALAQGGKIAEAERIWRTLLLTGPQEGAWRSIVEERLRMIDQARAAGLIP